MTLWHKIIDQNHQSNMRWKITSSHFSLSQVVPIHGLPAYCMHASNSGTAGGSRPGCGNPDSIWSWGLCAWSSRVRGTRTPIHLVFLHSLISNPELQLHLLLTDKNIWGHWWSFIVKLMRDSGRNIQGRCMKQKPESKLNQRKGESTSEPAVFTISPITLQVVVEIIEIPFSLQYRKGFRQEHYGWQS